MKERTGHQLNFCHYPSEIIFLVVLATVVTKPHVNPYEKSQGLSVEQARAMLLTCKRDTVIGVRDYALIVFYLYTGRRRIEIARLTWGDLRPGQDGSDSREYHYEGKGGKTAWRELPQPVWTAVRCQPGHRKYYSTNFLFGVSTIV